MQREYIRLREENSLYAFLVSGKFKFEPFSLKTKEEDVKSLYEQYLEHHGLLNQWTETCNEVFDELGICSTFIRSRVKYIFGIGVSDAELIVNTCCFCRETFRGYGNNPKPLLEKGKACNTCDRSIVHTARMQATARGDTFELQLSFVRD